MALKTAKRVNWKGIWMVFLFSVLGLIALANTANAAETPPVLKAVQLVDQHHYYTLKGQLLDQAVNVSNEVTIVWSIAGSGKWNETALIAEKGQNGNMFWNIDVALSTKSEIDRNGLIFEFKRNLGENTEWINNKGTYFTIGGKNANVVLGQTNVTLKQPLIDGINGVKGSVIVKNVAFRPTVKVMVKTTASAKPIIVSAVRKGSVYGSKNRLQTYDFTAAIPVGAVITEVTAVYEVNKKVYTDTVIAP